ncbi:aspartic proteinase [Colletotrichum plurivorum]|uniref:Aspartic proteinase n=1 Tax=Colletotrichum plurivorum TaxID=2175906 RepID=A0A8H6JK81_9PEZI|nr:aspartic proteinase [Colletotrichum plurivorum]
MRTSALFAAAACAATASAQLRLPFTRSDIDAGNTKSASGSRRSLSEVDLFRFDNDGYFVNVTVGTPPQEISLLLRVQSGESYVPDAEQCEDRWSHLYGACKYGSFASNESSTYVNPGTETFTKSYVGGGRIYGEVVSETLHIGGAELPKINLGVVESTGMSMSTRTSVGVLGLGFNDSAYVSSSSSGLGSSLPTVPDRLFQDGHIKSTAYSLWLDDESGASGNLLFGAVDKSKFDAPLIRFPIQDRLSTTRFDTMLHSVNASKTPADAFQPLLDAEAVDSYSDQTYVAVSPEDAVSWLPYTLAKKIYDLVGAVWSRTDEYWLVPCSANASEARLAIRLHADDGPVLDVPLADVVLPWDYWHSSEWSWDSESETEYCAFGVQSANSTSADSNYAYYRKYSLGGAMLRRSYMVFDLAGEEIAIAKAKVGSTAEEDVVAFESYGAAIPASTSVSPSWCSQGSSVDSCNSGGDSGSPYVRTSASPNRTVLLILIIVGVIVVVVIGLTIWAVMRCRRIRRAEAELAEKQVGVQDASGARENTGNEGGHGVSATQEASAAAAREPPPEMAATAAASASTSQQPEGDRVVR